MVTSDFKPEVEIRPFRACTMHPAIIIGTVRSLWTRLCGRYRVPQNAFLVFFRMVCPSMIHPLSAHAYWRDSNDTWHKYEHISGHC